MAISLTIRQLPEPVRTALEKRAAHSGRSLEAEACDILLEAVKPESSGKSDWLDGLLERAATRTGNVAQTDSADLIRESRDAR